MSDVMSLSGRVSKAAFCNDIKLTSRDPLQHYVKRRIILKEPSPTASFVCDPPRSKALSFFPMFTGFIGGSERTRSTVGKSNSSSDCLLGQ